MIELIVTVSVAGILLAIAIPSYSKMIASNRLSTTANLFAASYNLARAEAVRRNTTVQVCGKTANGSNPFGSDCGTAAGTVLALNSDNATTISIQAAVPVPAGISIDSAIGLRYGGQGLATAAAGGGPYTGLIAAISSAALSSNNHRCLYVTAGSILNSCGFTGNCPNSEPTTCQ